MSDLFVKRPQKSPFLFPQEVQVARDKLAELEVELGERVWAPKYGTPPRYGRNPGDAWCDHPCAVGFWEMLYARLWQCNHDDTHPIFDPISVWWETEAELQGVVREVATHRRDRSAWVEADLMLLVMHRYQWVYLDRMHEHLFPTRLPYSYRHDGFRWSYNNWVRWAAPHIGELAPNFLHTRQRDLLYVGEPLGEGMV